MSSTWADLPAPLLQQVFLLTLPSPALHFSRLLLPGTTEAAAAAAEQRLIAAFALVCRTWRQAAAAALESAAWRVAVQRVPIAAAELLRQLERLAVVSLDLRRLTWSEGGGGDAVAELLGSPAFRRCSGARLASAVGVPERLCSALAAGFPALQTVGLCEDYASTEGKAHSAPMQLAPLRALPRLRSLQLELGVADLAAVPPQVRQLRLTEADRLVLPPVEGVSVADRLLAAAAAAGWGTLRLEAASGCMVFEEAKTAPLELELSHLARLAAAAAGEAWSVQLSVQVDPALGQRRPCLEIAARRRQGAGTGVQRPAVAQGCADSSVCKA